MRPHTPVVTIHLAALIDNYRLLKKRAPQSCVGAAVKANGYGLGATTIAKTLYQEGCRHFFVAHFMEAIDIRPHVENAEIIVLHGLHESEFSDAAHHHLTPAINDLSALQSYSEFAQRLGIKLPAYMHFDTGMNRLGLGKNEQSKLINNIGLLQNLDVVCWMTHYVSSDEKNSPKTEHQYKQFNALMQQLPPAKTSLANSSGIFLDSAFHGDIVRPGLALYGGNPTPSAQTPMQAVMRLAAPILQVRQAEAGETVGYAETYKLTRRSLIATLALGYNDGFMRVLSNKGHVMLGQSPAPILGRISMDLTTIDVTDIPAPFRQKGQMAELIGPSRSLDQVAAEAGTIPYEILTSLGSRIERVYI
jgi:alanine racemase